MDICRVDIFVNFSDSDGNEYKLPITDEQYEKLKGLNDHKQMEYLVELWNKFHRTTRIFGVDY